MMLASIVLPRPTSSARMARPLMWRSTRWATSIWCGSALIAFASSVISRSKPGTRAIRSASRRSSCQARSVGGAWSRFANASRECLSTDQTSSAGGVGRGRTVGDSGIDTQRVARGPQYTSYQLSVISYQLSVLSFQRSAFSRQLCPGGLSIFLSFLEHALGHLELPARGGQSLRENLPDSRVFIRIVDFRATGIRHQGRGERVQVVVPSAELHEAGRRLAAVEMLVEPLERRHHERSFLPIELLHLLLLAVLEGRRADLVRPHHAETAAVEKDDRRARPVAVAALVGPRRELLHVQGHRIARHGVVGVVILGALARRVQFRLLLVRCVVDDGVGVVALDVDWASLARVRGRER